MNFKNNKIIIFALILSLAFPTFAFAKVGEDLFDPAKLQSTINYQPYANSKFTSYYTPWFKMFHIATKMQKQEGIIAGEACQQIKSIRVSPFDENIVLAGTDTNGIWKSTDGGNYWYNTGCYDFEYMYIPDIFFDKKNNGCVYMISSGGLSNKSMGVNDGVYKSEDNGKSWMHVLNIFISSIYTDKLIASDDNGNIYVIADDGVYKSASVGESWQKISNFEPDGEKAQSISVSPDGSVILASYSGNSEKSGLYISKDSGATWSKNTGLYQNQLVSSYATEIHPASKNQIVVSFEYPDGENTKFSLLKSSDLGETWSEISDTSWSKYCVTKLEYAKEAKNNKYRLYINRNKNNAPLCYTDNEGESYSFPSYSLSCSLQPNYTGYFAQGFDISDKNPDIVYASKGGVVKSNDAGESFLWSNSGFSGLNVAAVSQSASGRLCFSCHDVGIVTGDGIYDGKNYPSFKIAGYYTLSQTLYDPNDEKKVFAINLTDDEGYYIGVSNDYGNTFEKTLASETGQSFIQFNSLNKNIIYTNDYTSTDRGTTWTKNDVSYAAISPDGTVRYITQGEGQSREVYISTDSGETWNFVAAPGYTSRLGNKVIIDVKNPLKCYYLSSHNFFSLEYADGLSTKIKNFTLGNEPVKYNGIFSFAQNPNDEKHIIIGTMPISGKKAPGLMETYDGGKTWHAVRGLPGSRGVYDVTFSANTDEVFVCNCNGVILYDYNEYKKYMKEISFVSEYTGTLGSVGSVNGFEYDIFPLPENSFSRNGYEFLHWTDLKNTYNPKEEYTVASDIENFYAVWKYTGNYKYEFGVENTSFYSETGNILSTLEDGFDCLLKNNSMLLYKIDATDTGDADIKKATLKIYADRAYAGGETFSVYNVQGDFENYTVESSPVTTHPCIVDGGILGVDKITNGAYSLISIDITPLFKDTKTAFFALDSTAYTNGGTKVAGINHIGKKPYVEISTTNDSLYFTSKDETGSEFFVNSFKNTQKDLKLKAFVSSQKALLFSEATPVIAIYSENNEIKEVIICEKADITEGYIDIFSDNTVFDNYENSKIKVFLFNSISGIMPVLDFGLLE